MNSSTTKDVFLQIWTEKSIQLLELYPIFLMINLYNPNLENSSNLFWCDNESVIQLLSEQSTKTSIVTELLKLNIGIRLAHIQGKDNILCDAISRQKETSQLLKSYGINYSPTPAALRPKVPHLKVLRERGTFIAFCCALKDVGYTDKFYGGKFKYISVYLKK